MTPEELLLELEELVELLLEAPLELEELEELLDELELEEDPAPGVWPPQPAKQIISTPTMKA